MAANNTTKNTKTITNTSTPQALSSNPSMADLKSRVLSALSKLSDRHTAHIAAAELESIIRSITSDAVPMIANALLHDPLAGAATGTLDPASKNPSLMAARRETLRLIAVRVGVHTAAVAAHLPKLVAHIARRIRDSSSDSLARDACRDAAGELAVLYLRPVARDSLVNSSVVGVFVKPLLEVMGEQNKAVQAGAAMCLARVVECAGGGEVGDGEEGNAAELGGAGLLFQKLPGRICKMIGGQSSLAKAALLSVISSLVQVGAITSQSVSLVLQNIHECLENSDWATRKAASDTLSALANHCSSLIADGAAATITALEACRFDKVKPVRDSVMEALLLWKNISRKGDDRMHPDPKDGRDSEAPNDEEKVDCKNSNSTRKSESWKNLSVSSPPDSDCASKGKGGNVPEKSAALLKKRAPSLSVKDVNTEFFQKLEARIKNGMPVEVVVPHKGSQLTDSNGGEESNIVCSVSGGLTDSDKIANLELDKSYRHSGSNYHNVDKKQGEYSKLLDSNDNNRERLSEHRGFRLHELKERGSEVDEGVEVSQNDVSLGGLNALQTDAESEGSFTNNKSSLSVIQRQLMQLERQQASLMNMLQDFMGGSHDSMITLEHRVRSLERVVEEMARDLAMSSGRRVGNMMLGFGRSPGRSSGMYNSLHEFSSTRFGRGGDGRATFSERFLPSDGTGIRGRDPPWRPDSEQWDSFGYGAPRNGIFNSRRGFGAVSGDGKNEEVEHEGDQVSSRRAWDKGQGPFRLGEGPSARSVWQASKDEATLEAIRVAGDDNVTPRAGARVAIPELDTEVLANDDPELEKGPLWASWTRAMDALHIGDVDTAYVEVLVTCDDLLLVKLMDKSGPVIDQLSAETASEVLHVIGQFLLEQSLFDIALNWLQQVTDLVVEHGADFLSIPLDWKREILLNLHEASILEMPEDWDGVMPEQLMLQLASAWEVNLRQLIK